MSEHAITCGELETALRELAVRSGNGDTYYPALAEHIVAYVLTRVRERFEPGRAYEDDEGRVFLRSEIGDWVDRSGGRWGDDIPKRPLHRMARHPGYDAILAAVGDGMEHEEFYTGIAARVCGLLGGPR